jgi:hypothetical protein
MPTFQFRLTFSVKGGTLVDSDSESIQIDLLDDQRALSLAALHAESLSDANWLALVGRGYETEDDARRAGQRARELLQFAQVERRTDLDLGNDQKSGHMSDATKEKGESLAEEEIKVYDPVHGLAIYPEDPEPRVYHVRADFTVEQQWDRDLKDLLSDLHDSGLSLGKRESLACSIYGTAQSAKSQRATFLFLVTAIESLLEPGRRSAKAVSLVEKFIEEVRSSDLERSERDSLADTLKWLKQDSITRTGVQLVEQHLGQKKYDGKKAPSFFRECYSIRSQLLHEGEPEDGSVDLPQLVNSLDEMVSDLLNSVCRVEDVV